MAMLRGAVAETPRSGNGIGDGAGREPLPPLPPLGGGLAPPGLAVAGRGTLDVGGAGLRSPTEDGTEVSGVGGKNGLSSGIGGGARGGAALAADDAGGSCGTDSPPVRAMAKARARMAWSRTG